MVSAAEPNLIDSPGTDEHTWRAWPHLARLPPLDISGWRSAVIVAAHPDDEILGLGGMIMQLAASRVRLRLVAVTDGEASHPHADPVSLARRRAAESAAALAILGARQVEVIRLGMPDTGLDQREGDLAVELRRLCRGFDVCLAPWEGDAHADHEAAGRAARRARPDTLMYPVWMWHWARPADPDVPWSLAVQVRLAEDVSARKRAAITAFSSQLSNRASALGPVLPAGIVAHFTRDQEVLFR